MGCLRGAIAPLFKNIFPFPLVRGRGLDAIDTTSPTQEYLHLVLVKPLVKPLARRKR